MGQRGTARNAHRTALKVDLLLTPKLPLGCLDAERSGWLAIYQGRARPGRASTFSIASGATRTGAAPVRQINV